MWIKKINVSRLYHTGNRYHYFQKALAITGIYDGNDILHEEKKEEISLSRMTKAPTPTDKSKAQHDNTIRH